LSTAINRRVWSPWSTSPTCCAAGGALGYGYEEERQVDFTREAFFMLLEGCPALKKSDWAHFTLELEPYIEGVKRLLAGVPTLLTKRA